MDYAIKQARNLIQKADKVSVLTGAGISTDSGIPDFRGPDGIWTKDPLAEESTNIEIYLRNPKLQETAWQTYVVRDWEAFEPNAGHKALVNLKNQGKLRAITTQNIDGLHQAAGIPQNKMIEVHGNLREVICTACGNVTFKEHHLDPEYRWCCLCDGLLKPNIVFFGENLDDQQWTRAEAAAISCDVYLIVGTSLKVWPVADLPETALRSNAHVIIVNAQETDFDNRASVVIRDSISDVLPEILEATAT